jgi:hypothetical protein
MNKNDISEMISAYLKEYADSPGNKPLPDTVKALRRDPEEAFRVIGDLEQGNFQKPENLDPRDLDAPVFQLLITFVDLVPELVIPKMTNGFWGARYPYIQSAAWSKSTVFVPTIVDLLTDRSIYIKTLILDLIIQCPHLQVPEAMPKLEKLSKMKSFQESEQDRELLEKAKQCVASRM